MAFYNTTTGRMTGQSNITMTLTTEDQALVQSGPVDLSPREPPAYGWKPLTIETRQHACDRIKRHCVTNNDHVTLTWLTREGTFFADTIINFLDEVLSRTAVAERTAALQTALDQCIAERREEQEELSELRGEVADLDERLIASRQREIKLNEALAKAHPPTPEAPDRSHPEWSWHGLHVGETVYVKETGEGPFVLVQPTRIVTLATALKKDEKVSSPHEEIQDAWLVHTKKGESVRLPRAVLTAQRPRRLLARILTSPALASALFGIMTAVTIYGLLGK